jgi:ADP-heptose:LPS heptosyltransferase
VKNILFVKIGALGDLSYALPAAKALKSAFPCYITWVVGKTYQRFIEGHSYIDKIIVVDDKKLYSKKIFSRFFEMMRLVFKIRKRYDLVIIAHRDPAYFHVFNAFSRDMTFQLVREPGKNPKRFMYIEPLSTHESLAIKQLIELAANAVTPLQAPLVWEWDYSYIEPPQVHLPKSYMVLHLGGGVNPKTEFQLKRWPHWEKLVFRLLTETSTNLVFVGSPAEEVDYKKIEEKIQKLHPDKLKRCFNFMSSMSIRELVAVIQACDLFIGVDSGPLHIADSMDKPAIGLFGPTSPISWGLLSKRSAVFQEDVPCSPCYKDDGIFPTCQYEHRCMELLDVDKVFVKVIELLPKTTAQRLNYLPPL